jgi:hypothetical protein
MGRGKRGHAGHRGGDVADRYGARGSDNGRWDVKEPEDDPLRDLRPVDEEPEPVDPAGDEYVWPEMNDENEVDD